MNTDRIFDYFEQISSIPRGSGHMEQISAYCLDFAKAHNLKAVRDEANNVIIYKPASKDSTNQEPVILQGHLDMVCQKEETCDIDFLTDGIQTYIDGDYIKAKGTTLGADNGIAVAMILAILESDDIKHPPIEAVFTSDEEIGMLGANALSAEHLSAKKMINLDAGEPEFLTVSCAGGMRITMHDSYTSEQVKGQKIHIVLHGLLGGHSGVEIHKGRVNANNLAGRILNHLYKKMPFSLVSIHGGDKDNVITNYCEIELITQNEELLVKELNDCLAEIKQEIIEREPDFESIVEVKEKGEFAVLPDSNVRKLIAALVCAPSSVLEMSASIADLVETSINLGIVKAKSDACDLTFAMRSNKDSALLALNERMETFAKTLGFCSDSSGYYPPWEYNDKSTLQSMYVQAYKNIFGKEPIITAIHAGLECGMFAAKIKDLDCIAFGPETIDVHSVSERLSISSTKECYALLLDMLSNCSK